MRCCLISPPPRAVPALAPLRRRGRFGGGNNFDTLYLISRTLTRGSGCRRRAVFRRSISPPLMPTPRLAPAPIASERATVEASEIRFSRGLQGRPRPVSNDFYRFPLLPLTATGNPLYNRHEDFWALTMIFPRNCVTILQPYLTYWRTLRVSFAPFSRNEAGA